MGLFYRLFDRDYRDYRKQKRVFHRKLRKSVRKADLFDYYELNNMVEIWVNSMYEYYKRGAKDGIGSQTIIDQLAEVKAMFDEIHQLYHDWWINFKTGEIKSLEECIKISDEDAAKIEAKWNREHELYRLAYAKIGEYIEGWWD